MKKLTIEIEGIVPLLLCNNRLSNPLDPEAKEHKKVSGKRKKTDEDYEWLAKHEWLMGLYVNGDGDVIIPDVMLEASITNGAKESRKGKQFQSGFMVSEPAKLKNPNTGRYYKLDTIRDDPNHIDIRSVRIQRATIMRARPIFNEWSLEFDAQYDESIIDAGEIKDAIRVAGTMKAIGDYRPKFGRFRVVSIN